MSRSSAPTSALNETCERRRGDNPAGARSSRSAARQLRNRSASDSSRRQASEEAAGDRPRTLWLRPMNVRKSMDGTEIRTTDGIMVSRRLRLLEFPFTDDPVKALAHLCPRSGRAKAEAKRKREREPRAVAAAALGKLGRGR